MSFQTALTNLAALDVAGVAHNYSIAQIPESLGRAQLPALLVLPLMPEEAQEGALFSETGSGFEAIAFADGARTVTYSLTHLLLIAPIGSGAGIRSHLPALVEGIDAYFEALAADVRLGDSLLEPAQIRVEPGILPVGGVSYAGCAFRHTWLIAVE